MPAEFQGVSQDGIKTAEGPKRLGQCKWGPVFPREAVYPSSRE